MVSRLQVKASQIGKILQTLENKNIAEDKQLKKSASHGQGSKGRGDGPPQKKVHIDPIPPFNANKIRKSPSMQSTSGTVSTTPTIAEATTPIPTPTTEDKAP